MTKLTDIQVQKLPVPDKGQKTYWEEGFGVRVSQGGSKTFVLMHGKERRLTTLGKYPAMSLKTARQEALRLKTTETPRNKLMSFDEARTAYLADCATRTRPATTHVYRNYLNKLEKPKLTDITRADIDLTSPHAVTTWKVFFNWCVRNELADRNPFNHQRVSYGQRSRVLTVAEIKAIWHYEHPPYSDIIKLCLLTGQRVGEVTKFTNSWINDDTITIPSTIAKNGREHTVPFNLLTAQYLTHYVGNTFNGFSKAKKRMDEKTGVVGFTTHDLRRTFATIHVQLGTPVPVVEAMLNHKSGTISGVAAIYIRANFLSQMRAACLTYEKHIATITAAKA